MHADVAQWIPILPRHGPCNSLAVSVHAHAETHPYGDSSTCTFTRGASSLIEQSQCAQRNELSCHRQVKQPAPQTGHDSNWTLLVTSMPCTCAYADCKPASRQPAGTRAAASVCKAWTSAPFNRSWDLEQMQAGTRHGVCGTLVQHLDRSEPASTENEHPRQTTIRQTFVLVVSKQLREQTLHIAHTHTPFLT